MPDLPEQSRGPREASDARPAEDDIAPERRAVETAFGAPEVTSTPPNAPSNNGSHARVDDALTAPTDRPADNGRITIGAPGEADPTGTRDGDDVEATEAETEAGEEGDDGGDEGSGAAGRRKGGKARPRRSGWRSAIEWGLVIGGALLVALVVRTFLVQAFWIPSASMEPTLHEGDRVLVNKLSYDLHDVGHGDVIVFERPDEPSDVPHPEDEIPDLIKRVIALPGDVIEARDGVVYLNDEPLDEPYLAPDTPTTDLPRQEIPEGKVFVMGDNRTNSHDSRRFGAIDEGSIVGRAFLRIYPLDDIGGL